jgi:uncharacterized membrane protein YhhN
VTPAAWTLLALAGVAAVADWVVVWRRPSPAENLLKPAVLVLLVGVAVALDPFDGGQRAWFVVALLLSLSGDVLLLPAVDAFVPGLASFLLAHMAFVVGFWQVDRVDDVFVVGLAVVLVAVAAVAATVLPAVRRRDAQLVGPVIVYIAVITSMVVTAFVRGAPLAVAGAVVFAASDSILSIDRFVAPRRWLPVAVMVTYHVAQGLLVTSLVS